MPIRWQGVCIMWLSPLTLLLLPGSFVFGRDVHNSIGINVKGHLNLRDPSWSWWDTNLQWEEATVSITPRKLLFGYHIKRTKKISRTLKHYIQFNTHSPPTSWNLPSTLLSVAISLSPWHTTISTEVWPSAAVEKTCKVWRRKVGMIREAHEENMAELSSDNTPNRS